METLILTLDTLVVVLLLYFSYLGQKADPRERGPFRIRQAIPIPVDRDRRPR